MKRKGFFNRLTDRATRMSLFTLGSMYILVYLGVEMLVDNPIRMYNFCVFLSLSGVYFSWLLGGKKAMVYVTFFNLFFLAIFSKMLWSHGIIIYGGGLFLARSFISMYVCALGLIALMLLKKSPADARVEEHKQAAEEARQRQQNLEFMVASRKLKQDLIAQANIVKDELQLIEGAWKSNVHDIINDLPTVKERELYAQIIKPFEENIIRHLRELELRLTFDLEPVSLAELHDFIRQKAAGDFNTTAAITLEEHGWRNSDRSAVIDKNKIWDMVVNVLRNSQAAIDLKRIEMLRSGSGSLTPRMLISCEIISGTPHIRIVDNGGGVSDDMLARLYQEPVPSRKRGEKKPGQGTLFVKFFAERMGMTVCAENTAELGGPGLSVELRLTADDRKSSAHGKETDES